LSKYYRNNKREKIATNLRFNPVLFSGHIAKIVKDITENTDLNSLIIDTRKKENSSYEAEL
jgi:hypothetical protein